MNDKVTNCFSRFDVHGLQYVLPFFDQQSILDNLCKWKNGIVDCLSEVVRPCDSSITHMLYDADNFGKVISGLCRDKNYTFLAYTSCSTELKTKSVLCLRDLRLRTQTMIEDGDYILKTTMCRIHIKMAECMSLTPDATCAHDYTLFLNKTFFTLFTLRDCEGAPSSDHPAAELTRNNPVSKTSVLESSISTMRSADGLEDFTGNTSSAAAETTSSFSFDKSCSMSVDQSFKVALTNLQSVIVLMLMISGV